MAEECHDLHEKIGAHGEKLENHDNFLEDLRDDVKDLKRWGLLLLLLNLGVTSVGEISPETVVALASGAATVVSFRYVKSILFI